VSSNRIAQDDSLSLTHFKLAKCSLPAGLSRAGSGLDEDDATGVLLAGAAFVEEVTVFEALGGANGDDIEDAVTSSAPHSGMLSRVMDSYSSCGRPCPFPSLVHDPSWDSGCDFYRGPCDGLRHPEQRHDQEYTDRSRPERSDSGTPCPTPSCHLDLYPYPYPCLCLALYPYHDRNHQQASLLYSF
jgi:hypothetical protein